MNDTAIPPLAIEPVQQYIVGDTMRRVLAIGNGHVIYSRGGDRHHERQVRTFLHWLKSERLDARPR